MADWMTCPGCQLRHSRRPDGLCPRCKQPVDSAAPTDRSVAVGATTEAAPFSPPITPAGAPPASPSLARLGSLSQAARSKELKNARGIMFFIGAASLLLNGYFFGAATSNVQAQIDKELAKMPPGFVVDPVKLALLRREAVKTVQLVSAGGMLLGAVFVACGALVRRHPVPITVTALALYLGGNAIFGMIDPASLAAGLVMKIIIVVALFKAVQAAIAYQKEQATIAVAA